MELGLHPYDKQFKERLDSDFPALSGDLRSAANLPDQDARKLIAWILELACQCQNMRNITLGREAAMELPREWLLQRIEDVADAQLNLSNDDWEYLRLLEVAQMLDSGLESRLVQRGLSSTHPEILDTARWWSDGENRPEGTSLPSGRL